MFQFVAMIILYHLFNKSQHFSQQNVAQIFNMNFVYYSQIVAKGLDFCNNLLHYIIKEVIIMNVSETLRKLRESHHLQLTDVADAIGMSRQGYNNYETGSRKPSLDTLVKLAKFYNVSTDYLLGVSDLDDSSAITKNDVKITDEKAEKLLQSFLQLPDSVKVGVMQWLENTTTILDVDVKPLTQTQEKLVERYENQEPKPPIMQSKPQQASQPMQNRQAGPVQQPPPQMVQKRKSILPKPQTIDEPRKIVKNGKVYEEVRYVAHDKSGNSNFGTLWVNEEDLKNAETDDYSKYD